MKDLTYEIGLDTYEEMLKLASKQGYDYFIITGTLLDSAMIMDNERLRIGNAKPRKYIIMNVVYLNEWSSKLVMTMTDNEELADEFYSNWQMFEDEYEEEEYA